MACVDGCFTMYPAKTRASKVSGVPQALTEEPPTLLKLRSQSEAKLIEVDVASEVTSYRQSSFDTANIGSLTTLETMDDDSMRVFEGSETFTQRSLFYATEDVTMSTKICGTEFVNGVLYYRLHTPIPDDMVSSVLRSYSDFVKLDSALAASHCSRRAVPIARGFLPRAEVMGLRRSLNEVKFMHRRQEALQKYLDVIAAQWPSSSQDQGVQDFLHRGASHENPTLDTDKVPAHVRQKTTGDSIAWLLMRAQAKLSGA
jgi:hypothetical protein